MKLRKIFAGIAATAVATTMAVSATAENMGYVVFADGSWFWGSWGYNDTAKGYCEAGATDVSKDGTYTVYIDTTLVNTENLGATGIDEETGDPYGINAIGVSVFCVDIEGLADAVGLAPMEGSAENLDHGNISITDVKVTASTKDSDGNITDQVIEIADEDVTWGNIEGKGNLRIELANLYGTKDAEGNLSNDPMLEPWISLIFNEKLAVTFTITGVDEALAGGADEPETPDAPADPEPDAPTTGDSSKPNTNTGVEGVALVAGVAVLAAGAVVVSKKRK